MPNLTVLQQVEQIGGKSLVEAVKASDRLVNRIQNQLKSPKLSSSQWQQFGKILSNQYTNNRISLLGKHNRAEITWIASDCIHICVRPIAKEPSTNSWHSIPAKEVRLLNLEVVEGSDALEIRTATHTYRLGKHPFRLGVEDISARLISLEYAGIFTNRDGGIRLSMALHPTESSYGLGGCTTSLQLRGQRLAIGYNPEKSSARLHSSSTKIPFYLGLHANGAYGLLWDNTHPGYIDIGATNPKELMFESESDETSYYLFVGSTVEDVLSRLSDVTGKIALPPMWALGYHYSHFDTRSEADILVLADSFRQHRVPCDAIHFDISCMQDFQTFSWDKSCFPNPALLMAELRGKGFKTVASLMPGIPTPVPIAIQNHLLRLANGETVSLATWCGMSGFPDFFHPVAQDWWKEQIRTFAAFGIDGFRNTMSGPGILTEEGPQELSDRVHPSSLAINDSTIPQDLQPHYSSLMAQATWEGILSYRPEKRPLSIISSGYIGTQSHSIVVSEPDQTQSAWNQLRTGLSKILSMGLSGIPMAGPNIAGKSCEEDGELYTRWLQLGCLLPFFSTHAGFNVPYQLPWSFGTVNENINRQIIELRYSLLPYIYSTIALCREYGKPIVRPLFIADPTNLSLRDIDDCFLLGDNLLVAPVIQEGQKERTIYLPKGEWYDYWTNYRWKGSQTIRVPAPLERLLIFVRAGAVIPHWPALPHVNSHHAQNLVYRVYPGRHETVLYEDSGEGFKYRDGNYRWLYLVTNQEDSILTIKQRVAGTYQPPYEKLHVEVIGLTSEPVHVRVDRRNAPLWFFDAGILELVVDRFDTIDVVGRTAPEDPTASRRLV